MKNLLLKFTVIALLMLNCKDVYSQCTGCTLNITVPNNLTYSVTAGTTICITGTGTFTGRLNNFNGNTLCIGAGVIYNPLAAPNYNGNWTIINNGTFQNVNNLNFNSGCNFTNALTGTITLGSSTNINCPFVNNGTLNAGSITANTSITLGGTTTLSGSLTNNATLTITGAVVAGSITNNNSIVGGAGTNCNSLRSTGAFSNSGTIGSTGQYLYVANTGGSILSPASTVSPAAPPSQPTSLALSNSGTTINGSFTQCVSSGYVILRAIAASVPATTNPTNMASLAVGQSVGAWTVAAINSGQSTTTFADNVGATCSNIYYRIYAYNSGGSCRVYNVSSPLTGTYNRTPTITATSPATICGAGTATLGATASAGTINWYAAASGGASIGTGTSFAPSISSTTTYYVDATNNSCTTASRTAVVATLVTAPTSVAGTDINTCANSGAVNITAGASASGYSSFSWASSGTGIITNPSSLTLCTYTPSLLDIAAGTVTLRLNVTGNAPCGTIFSTKTLTITPNVTASVSIAATATTTCAGNTEIFTATPINGGTTPSYQWKKNGVNVGTNSTTFATSALANGDVITCVMTSNATCVIASPATSNALIMTVNALPTITGSTPGSRINTGTVVLGATCSSGGVFWYTTLTGGGPIGSGNSWTTPSIGVTTTYYASAMTLSGCSSTPRTPVVATVNNPEIDIQGNATTIPDGDTTPITTDWTDFGSAVTTKTYTIRNTGVAVLNLGTVMISGANASDFSVTSAPSATVAAGGSTTFTIAFNPTAGGTRTATISIDNDDNNENPYDFSVQGTGIAQEITVQGNALTITDGDNSPTTADWTDFSNVTFTRTYTIQNSGNVPLTIGSIGFSGPNATEFAVTTLPVSTIPAYGSTTFTVTFSPLGVGVRVATLNIANDDSDENPYDFSIIATGVNIDSDGDGVNNGTDSDDDNDGITDVIECGTCLTDPFTNGSFEVTSPILGATTYSIMPAANVTGWQSSPENLIEIWSTGFNGVDAAQGNQFAELNANVAGTLYQTFCLNGASGTITWSIKHRGRSGVDQAFVRFGTTLADAQTNTPIATMVDGTGAWGLYSGTYIIPAGQTQIVLAFQAGYTASGSASVGNFIDDVQITINQACVDTDSDGMANIIDLDDDNDGVADIEEAGFKNYSNNTSTFDKTNAANWRDTNANGMNDYIDTLISAGTYAIPDTDGDGIPNYLDLDSDNDSLFDVDEAGLANGDGDINGDGKGDGSDTDRDGILNLYDNSVVYGTVARAYAQDTNANGVPDYLQLDSNADGINDIQTGLYGSLDTNNDGKIDGSTDIDRDGILDAFDTNTAAVGSPRNLNRKLFLDFDGRNDYGQGTGVLSGLPEATLMAWIDLNSAFSSEGIIVGQDKFQMRVTSGARLEAMVNSTILKYNFDLNASRWYHVAAVYGGGFLKLYLNGVQVISTPATGNIAADASLLTLGKDPSSNTKYFKGKIDEVRIFNTALTDAQVQRMVYQEIQNTAGQVRGAIVPKDIQSLPYTNLLRYYKMDAYKDDIIDDFTTAAIDAGTGMKIYNHKVIKVQEAPMPFVTKTTGTFAAAINDPSKDIRGLDATDFDYSIVQVKHNITETANATDLAMFVDPGVTVTMNNNTKIQNDWYLKLDGKIDLQGRSQLIQTANSDLDVTSAGSIERDQQGQSNKFNYNYWSSPVGAINATTNNNAFTIGSVLRDGTDPNNPQNITWSAGYNGAPTSPITLSSYWIFKFQNLTPVYSNWSAVGDTGTLQAAQGFTMKGTGSGTASQNYTFVGKPNNGTITSTIAGGNLNLCGNPYPSALDADAFITANSASITGTLYFWEHFGTNTSHNLLDYQGGYAARNLVGGTPPVSPTGVSTSGGSTRIPSRYIPVGQGFLVYGSGTGGTITFNNNQRSFVKENDPTSNVMFRQNNQDLSIIDKQFDNHEDRMVETQNFSKIRIGFNSVNNYHRQILLGFMNEFATDAFDIGYDASQLDTQPNDLYFAIPGQNLVIQGVGAYDAHKVLPLSLKNGMEGNVQFTLDATENFDASQNIYIYDSVTEQYHDIRSGNFEINLPVGTYDTRFSLRFSNTALDINDFDLSQEVVISFTSNDAMININNNLLNETIKSVDLYNILGQSIRSWNVSESDQSKVKIPVTNISTGAYIVKVHTTKGDLSKKIIIK